MTIFNIKIWLFSRIIATSPVNTKYNKSKNPSESWFKILENYSQTAERQARRYFN